MAKTEKVTIWNIFDPINNNFKFSHCVAGWIDEDLPTPANEGDRRLFNVSQFQKARGYLTENGDVVQCMGGKVAENQFLYDTTPDPPPDPPHNFD